MLKIDIVTLFPKMFDGPLKESLMGKAKDKGLVRVQIHDLRLYSKDKHKKVDDKQFGGGAGMVLKVEPIFNAIQALSGKEKPWVVYLSPQGQKLSQRLALDLSKKRHLILLCGHYEGIDERAMQWIDQEISIGDYVLMGGELPAMVLTETVCRLVPGVVKEWESIENDSFFNFHLDYAHYTRPAEFCSIKVPDVLLSGHHKEIEKWRQTNALQNTAVKRPDLFQKNEVRVS